MYFDLAPLHFNVLLGWEAHQRAESIRSHYSGTLEANQAYCYALSRSVGEVYLKFKGFNVKETDFSTWNFKTQHITDIACVDIEGIGRVQFIPATTAMNSVEVPSEARSNKVAYVIVQLDEEPELLEELNEASLVGFVNRVEVEELSLEKLRAIDELPEYLLEKLEQKTSVSVKDSFSTLIDSVARAGLQFQQAISETISTSPVTIGLAGTSSAGINSLDEQKKNRGKIIWLGTTSVRLAMELEPISKKKAGVLVRLSPSEIGSKLPPDLKLALITDKGAIWEQQYDARQYPELIEVKRYFVQYGSHFTLEITLGEIVEKITITSRDLSI